MKRNWIDKAVGLFSPEAEFKRLRARIKRDIIARHYEGAAHGRRTSGWKTKSTDANTAIGPAKQRVRDRARDLVRNDPFASRAVSVAESNVIGCGIETSFKNADGTTNKALTDEFREWANTPGMADFEGRLTYGAIQALVFRSTFEGGEALGLPIIEGGKNPRFSIRALEGDYLDDKRTGNNIVDGIELDEAGRRSAYYIWERHPGDGMTWSFRRTSESKRVPASQVYHVFRADRLGQMRGISWFAPVLIMMRELDELFDGTLVKQKVAAAFAAFVHDIEAMPDSADDGDQTIGEKLEPGIIEVLPSGKSVTFANPPASNDFDPLTRAFLRAIAAGLGMSYEAFTGDLSGVNFSSGRMGWQEFGRKIDQWQWNMMIPLFCYPVAMDWLKFKAVQGKAVDGVKPEFTCPQRSMVDPVAETNALVTQVRAGIKSLPDVLREQGFDPVEKVKEIAEFNKVLDESGVILDTDPRKTMKSGSIQTAPANTEENQNPENSA